jgi:hypothetical protein
VRRAGGASKQATALIRHGTYIFFEDHRRAGDVGDAFQFGRAARLAHHHFKALQAGGQHQRQQLAARLGHVDVGR